MHIAHVHVPCMDQKLTLIISSCMFLAQLTKGAPVASLECLCLVQICVLEGKTYGEASQEEHTEAFLDANTLLVNAQGKELLAPGRGAEHTADKRVVTKFIDGKVKIPGLELANTGAHALLSIAVTDYQPVMIQA